MFKTVRKNGKAKRGNCFNRKYCIDDFAIEYKKMELWLN